MIDSIFNAINNFQLIYLVKALLLVIAVFYFVFTLVVFQQISLMSQVIETTASWVVRTLGVGFIVAAVVLFVLVILLL